MWIWAGHGQGTNLGRVYLVWKLKMSTCWRKSSKFAGRLVHGLLFARSSSTLPAIREAAQYTTLHDKHGRYHNYLRISLTERCSLRCKMKSRFKCKFYIGRHYITLVNAEAGWVCNYVRVHVT